MALSVRLPEGRGPHIEHYLIEDGGSGKLHLEGSDNYFSAIPMLVSHYSNCCDELPVQLTLPKVLSQSNRQQLTSLALLGQDFWQSSLSKLTNSNDNQSDDKTSSTNSLNRRNNSCSTFKSDISSSQPPPIPPKQDVSNIDPIIDTKKSSTVPILQVTAQPIPKIATKRPDPPPVPPRSKFVNINNTKNLNPNNTSMPSNNNQVSNESVAPNTEITLIQLRDNKCRLNSQNDSAPNSSLTDNMPKDITKNSTNAQKKVLCYRSSLHDKESDYEDIWGANTASKLTLNSTFDSIEETKCQLSRSTQTEAMTTINRLDSTRRHISSPFYIDPIDAISNRTINLNKSSHLCHSDTDISDTKPSNSSLFGHSMESLIDNIRIESSQVDTCQQMFSSYNPNLQDVSIQVGYSTFAKHCNEVRETSWPLDNSWQWLDDNFSSIRRSFKRESGCRSSFVESLKSDVTTVEDLINVQVPELTVPKGSHLSKEVTNGSKNCDQQNNELNERYDNLAAFRNSCQSAVKQEINDTDTEFSEPWDSDWWDGLVKKVFPRNALLQFSPETEENMFLLNRQLNLNHCENGSTITSLSDSHRTSTFDITEVSSINEMPSNASLTDNRDSTASDRLTVLEANDCGIGLNICNYIFELSAEGNNTFAKSIDHFIQCTKESNETNPMM